MAISPKELRLLLQHPIAFHQILAKITGSLTAGLLLSQAIYWTDKGQDGWFWKKTSEWCDELYMGRAQVESARSILRACGFIIERLGQSGRIHFFVDLDAIAAAITEYSISGKPAVRSAEPPKSDSQENSNSTRRGAADRSAENPQDDIYDPETTAETTSKTTSEDPPLLVPPDADGVLQDEPSVEITAAKLSEPLTDTRLEIEAGDSHVRNEGSTGADGGEPLSDADRQRLAWLRG